VFGVYISQVRLQRSAHLKQSNNDLKQTKQTQASRSLGSVHPSLSFWRTVPWDTFTSPKSWTYALHIA